MKTPLLPLLLFAAAPAFAAPAACPQADGQLSEYLASAKQRIGFDGEVRVEFEVGADGRARLIGLQGTRSYQAPVRSAVDSLECQAGTPQRYVLNIRFADPTPVAVAAAASATLAQARPADAATPR
jgi:outer membrane biosynthesis protein TonB